MPIRKGGKAGKQSKTVPRYQSISPTEPTIVSVVNSGFTYFSGQFTITFTPPTYGALPTSYTITATSSSYGTKTFSGVTSSPFIATGLRGGTNYTWRIKANHTSYGDSNERDGGSSESLTVPDAPTAVTASSPEGTSYDSVSWLAPADNGGAAITNYEITSSDGKTVYTSGTSININQEGGTAQTYRVRAYNSKGWSELSSASGSVTTFSFTPFGVFSFAPFGVFTFTPVFSFAPFGVFSFAPFGVFSFTPFGVFTFTPVFSFAPFGVFTFTPFGVFSFAPFGVFSFAPVTPFSVFSFIPFSVFGFSPFSPFSVFGFSPFGVFGFSPFSPFSVFGFSPFGVFGFSPFGVFGFSPVGGSRAYSLGPRTKVVMSDGTLKEAQDLNVGDELKSVSIPGLLNTESETIFDWSSLEDLQLSEEIVTTINKISTHAASAIIRLNGDAFSPSHLVLVKREGTSTFEWAKDVVSTDLIWSHSLSAWAPIIELEVVEETTNVITINCEPYDIFFTEHSITHDGKDWYDQTQTPQP